MTRISCTTLLLFILLAISSSPVFASPFSGSTEFGGFDSEPEFLPVEEAYQLDLQLNEDSLTIAWILQKNYFLYRHGFENSIVTNQNLQVIEPAALPKGIEKDDEYFGRVEIYYDQVVYDIPLPEADPFLLKTSSQGCADAGLCYPPYHLYFEVSVENRRISPITAEAFQQSLEQSTPAKTNSPLKPKPPQEDLSIAIVLISAIIGGLILNLMPCVLPVLSIKLIQLARQHDPVTTRIHGLIYMAGVILSFLGIATLMLTLRSGGEAIGWGFQLQNPWFVALLVYLFFLLGLNMLGWFSFGNQFMGTGQELTEKGGAKGAFFTGVLAVVVASPCTAPFMGSALGYAISQSAGMALLTFAALGFGMALPLTLASLIPAVSSLFPKPGQWMDRLKQFFSFPLFATAIWLNWVLSNQAGSNASALILLGCLLLALGIWFWKTHNRASRILSITVLALGLALPFSSMISSKPKAAEIAVGYVPFTQARFEEYRAEGKAVFIDLTADWCITCIANEKSTLETEEIQQAFKDAGIIYMVGDWTDYNPEITELLNQYRRSGIPLYLLFPPRAEAEATILPQILTKSIVLEAISNNK